MQPIDGSVTFTDQQGNTVEESFFTYSESEKQQNEINRENAKLIFSPEFIPFYLDISKKYNLSPTKTLVYGFIRFYISYQVKMGQFVRFYFSNIDLANMLNVSESIINQSLKELKEKGLIQTKQKMKAGGGTLRFINWVLTDINLSLANSTNKNLPNSTCVPLHINKNNINNNKREGAIPVSKDNQEYESVVEVTPLTEISSNKLASAKYLAETMIAAYQKLNPKLPENKNRNLLAYTRDILAIMCSNPTHTEDDIAMVLQYIFTGNKNKWWMKTIKNSYDFMKKYDDIYHEASMNIPKK